MKWTLLISIIGLSAVTGICSPQIPDYIIYENDTVQTYNLLVEQYLQNKKSDKGQLFGLSKKCAR